jgi:hypothetical protein
VIWACGSRSRCCWSAAVPGAILRLGLGRESAGFDVRLHASCTSETDPLRFRASALGAGFGPGEERSPKIKDRLWFAACAIGLAIAFLGAIIGHGYARGGGGFMAEAGFAAAASRGKARQLSGAVSSRAGSTPGWQHSGQASRQEYGANAQANREQTATGMQASHEQAARNLQSNAQQYRGGYPYAVGPHANWDAGAGVAAAAGIGLAAATGAAGAAAGYPEPVASGVAVSSPGSACLSCGCAPSLPPV